MMEVDLSLYQDEGLTFEGVAVLDIETRRKKQQALMVQLVERQVRSRAQQLYETRGQVDGQDLQDWFQAESEILENSILATLYRRLHTTRQSTDEVETDPVLPSQDSSASGSPA
jgi:hypothetical protein